MPKRIKGPKQPRKLTKPLADNAESTVVSDPTIDYPDLDPMNADWPKMTWDLPDINNVTDLKALLVALQITVADFKTFPIYKYNVGKLPWLKDL